jgi:hypothetical protein
MLPAQGRRPQGGLETLLALPMLENGRLKAVVAFCF